MTAARVLPDGCTDLLWRRGVLEVAGPDTRHREVPLGPGEVIVGVRLRPGAARPLLGGVPATAVADAQPGLNELWGDAALRLSDELEGVREPWRIAGLLAGALGERMAVHGPDRVAVAVAAALDRPRPPGIARLAWDLGFSERQLRRRVRAAAGYGPKTLEQILRFRRVLEAAAPAFESGAVDEGVVEEAAVGKVTAESTANESAEAGTASARAAVDGFAVAGFGGAGSDGREPARSGPALDGVSVGAPAVGSVRPRVPASGSVRFRGFVPARQSAPDWARIAAEAGYADQAHLSREVRHWSGATPRALAAGARAACSGG